MSRVKIDKLVFGGQGLGRLDNKVYFAWNALPGEEIEFESLRLGKKFNTGIATKIYTPSPHRVSPCEDHFLICSPLQILDWDEENKLKVEMAKENYYKLAGLKLDNLDIVFGEDPYHYRNKMEYSFVWDNDKISLAFFERGTQKHTPISGCELASKEINIVAEKILVWLNQVKPPIEALKSVILRSNGKGQVIAALFVRNKDKFANYPELDETLKGFYIYYSNPFSPASIPTEIVYKSGAGFLVADLNGFKLKFGLLSFFQINIPIFSKVLEDIGKMLGDSEEVVDFYGGVGAISIPLARQCKRSVVVDNNSEAIEYAKENISLNKLKNYSAELKSSEKLFSLIDGNKTLIFDPPREGLHPRLVDKVLECPPKRIFYLSCDLATQARDLKILTEKYKIVFNRLYNFFPRTPHIEELVVLERK